MSAMSRRCVAESLRQLPLRNVVAGQPVLFPFASELRHRSLTTETSSTSEPAIDARSIVGATYNPQAAGQSNSPQPRSVESAGDNRSVVGYTRTPPRDMRVPVAGRGYSAPRRVSQVVMALQVKMFEQLSNGKAREAVKLFESFVNEGFKEAATLSLPVGQLPPDKRPAEFQWLQYIQALSRSERIATRQIESAMTLMRQTGIQVRQTHYIILLENLRRQGSAYHACRVIDEMIKSGIKPNTRCYEEAIFTCLIARDLDSTSMLLDSLFRSATWSRQAARYRWYMYTRVILFCAALKRIENALTFLRQMRDLQLHIPINVYLELAVNAAEVDDTAAVDSLLVQLEKIRRFVTTEDRKRHQVPLHIDEGVFLVILNSAARTGQSFLADQAWTMLKNCLRIPLFHDTLNMRLAPKPEKEKDGTHDQSQGGTESQVEATAEDEEEEEDDDIAEEDHDVAHEFVKPEELAPEDEWQESLQPYLRKDIPMVESYHAFIEAQAKAGNIETAFNALLELEQHHPDNPSDLSPAQGLCMLADELAKDANTVDQAYYALDQRHKAGEKVTATMLDVIVAACARMGDANRAFETFEAYPTLGLAHRTESYNALMEVCASQRQVEVIMKLLQEMSKGGVKPNADTYMQIIEGYINNGDTSGISHALTITRREGFMPTLKVLERAFECADKYNDDNARQLIRRELLAADQLSALTFRGRGRGRGRRGPFRGRDGGRFPARASPYARNDDQNFNRAPGPGRGGGRRERPVQTYVGERAPDSPPAAAQPAQTYVGERAPDSPPAAAQPAQTYVGERAPDSPPAAAQPAQTYVGQGAPEPPLPTAQSDPAVEKENSGLSSKVH